MKYTFDDYNDDYKPFPKNYLKGTLEAKKGYSKLKKKEKEDTISKWKSRAIDNTK
jgi:hypothetical protein